MNWLHYLLEANLYLGVLYLCYCLFFNRETHYNLNRAYLLFSCIVSFVLPLLQLGILIKPAPVVMAPVSYALPVNLRPIQITLLQPAQPQFTWQDGLVYIYCAGAAVFLLILLFKLFQLVKITRRGKTADSAGYKVVYLDEPDTAFSFFKYLFIGKNPKSADTIIRHELVHIRQKHSVDIMFLELLKVINWFNPFIYLLQRSLRAVHEYIADEKTASAENGALAYSSFLVDNAYGLSGTSVTHSFFNYNLLKKRIIMLHQKRSGRLAKLKYLLTVPVCAGLLCASTLAFSKTYGWVDLAPHKLKDLPITTPAKKPVTKNVTSAATEIESQKNGKPVIVHASSEPWHVSNKGYRYLQTAYLINGQSDFRVLIWDNHNEIGFWKSKATPKEIKMLKEKYDYIFPDMPIYGKLPPPPPAMPAGNQLPSPPPAPNKPSAQLPTVLLTPPADTSLTQVFHPLYDRLMRTILYPATVNDQKIHGRVIIKFEITADKKIENIEPMRSTDDLLTNSAIRSLQKCQAPEQAKAGVYVLPVFFQIVDSNNNTVGTKLPDKDYHFTPLPNNATSLSEIVVTRYIK